MDAKALQLDLFGEVEPAGRPLAVAPMKRDTGSMVDSASECRAVAAKSVRRRQLGD